MFGPSVPGRRRRHRRRRLSFLERVLTPVALVVIVAGCVVLYLQTRPAPAGVTAAVAPAEPSPSPSGVASVLPTVAAATQVVSPRARLEADLAALVAANHVSAGIAVIDLSGPDAATWSLNGTARFDAASTYKLPVLMYNAEQVAARKYSPSDSICMKEGEDEGDSWFRDYEVGKCFTRQVLATRVGRFSDNTGARMLADNMGGAARLNTYARSRGAAGSTFYSGNTTDAMDLANLWSAEVRGTAGGKPAQDWLYPLLEKTATELGIPAGVPRTTTVAHKTGWIDTYVLDAGVVFGGPRGDYILAVAEKGKSSSAGGWAFVKAVSARVWAYQQER